MWASSLFGMLKQCPFCGENIGQFRRLVCGLVEVRRNSTVNPYCVC